MSELTDYLKHVSSFGLSTAVKSMWSNLTKISLPETLEYLFKISESAKFTFFVSGIIAERNPKLVAEIVDNGHEIASHGYHHICLAGKPLPLVRKEVKKSFEILSKYAEISGFRPPYLYMDEQLLCELKRQGFTYISSDSTAKDSYKIQGLIEVPIKIQDWDYIIWKDRLQLFKDYLNRAKSGILLLHPPLVQSYQVEFENLLKMTKPIPIYKNFRCKKISISFDLGRLSNTDLIRRALT